ncbi:MAG: alpha/beta hydrolase [Chloroflexi bacterium]|nr:alpha/beta hydrolase [Chloroflexota bacterium]
MQLEIITHHPEERTHKTPLLFVHGAWHGAWCWEEHLLPYAASLGWQAHALSLRGHAGSPTDRPIWQQRVHHYVEDVLAVVASLERTPVLVGHSMGGFVVQHTLTRIDAPAAVLFGSAPPWGIIHYLLRWAAADPWGFAKTSLFLNNSYLVETPEQTRRIFHRPDDPLEWAAAHHSRLSPESMLATLDLCALQLVPAQKVNTPLFVIGGGADTIFPPGTTGLIADRCGADCVILPGVPHDIMLDRDWQRAADAMLTWLAAHGL